MRCELIYDPENRFVKVRASQQLEVIVEVIAQYFNVEKIKRCPQDPKEVYIEDENAWLIGIVSGVDLIVTINRTKPGK